MPKINGHLLSALLLCAIFTTPALSVGYEYSCGCDNGYYGLRYIGSGSYACTKCPYGPTSIDDVTMHPSTGAGTGIFTLNGDCYY
ncbi:MAG: hypothetical protein IAC77_01225 [Proteobacteria bacterium]|uniref:Uncharacterized protein n=1 Tax=Candidatus Enterousia excrementavium TaxID=2840789 RepID=A0A940DEL3_9PROT|nr:hypothetical protein [Candidatus Enterousia excrementavium]